MKFNRFLLVLEVTILILVLFFATVMVIEHLGLTIHFNGFNTPEMPEATTTPEEITIPEITVKPTPEATQKPVSTYLEIHQINVGCANAYLIKSDEIAIVIDGGLSESKKKVLSYIENQGITSLDAYIATHWHGDHVGNMTSILDKFGDADTLVYGPSATSNISIPSGKGTYTQMKDGDVITFNNITIKCMGPYRLSQNGSCNYDSINFLVNFGEIRAFFTGDYVHKEILNKYSEELKDIDIYQMAHHGLKVSDFSGNFDVLPTLRPEIILVPANSSTPSRNKAASIGINADFYDNKSGNVIIRTDGTSINVNTEK